MECKCPERCWCPEGKRRYDRERWARRKDQHYAQKKVHREATVAWYRSTKERPCTDCGVQHHHAAMQWDHLPGTEKVGDPSALAGQGRRGVLESELKKCELVCANCHAIRTFERRQGVV